MRLAVSAFLLSAAMVAPGHAQQPAPAAVPVGVVMAEKKPISKSLDFVGRVEAINRVEIKARITGFLEALEFKEGDRVKKGAPLYKIEKGLFEASVKQAEGALERAKSAKVLTEVQLQRAVDLLEKASGTVVARDQALASDQQARGAILEAEAALQSAKINLGYTDITSPIDGKIGRTSVTIGNVVSPEKGTLTTVVSEDPIYATFPVSQREFLRAQQTGKSPDLKSLNVKLRFSDGSMYDQVGKINFVDVTVDKTTDTVIARATMPNPKGALIDGQLMTIVIEAGTPEEKVVIPQSALISDQQGLYVFVVDGGKAAVRRVKVGDQSGMEMVIESGINAGDQVIVDGVQSIRPGASVRATPVAPAAGRS